jgi:hypothetical protein
MLPRPKDNIVLWGGDRNQEEGYISNKMMQLSRQVTSMIHAEREHMKPVDVANFFGAILPFRPICKAYFLQQAVHLVALLLSTEHACTCLLVSSFSQGMNPGHKKGRVHLLRYASPALTISGQQTYDTESA